MAFPHDGFVLQFGIEKFMPDRHISKNKIMQELEIKNNNCEHAVKECTLHFFFLEQQNGLGWKEPLKIIYSNTLL